MNAQTKTILITAAVAGGMVFLFSAASNGESVFSSLQTEAKVGGAVVIGGGAAWLLLLLFP